MTNRQISECLLCGNESVAIADTLTGRQLRALWNICGNDLSEDAFGPITPEYGVNLYRCTVCGFRFYDPSLAGSAEFYEELMASRSYPEGSPEFAFVLGFAKKHGLKRVLDIGGGEGAFLDMAHAAGMDTSGVELNRNAAEIAARKGHRMFNKPLTDITLEDMDGGADLLTLFQVVEHVPSPVGFVSEAASLVRPGGYLAISVPSERRMLGLLHKDPANWPPHHISRWRPGDFCVLAEKVGLKIVAQGANKLTGSAIPWAWDLHNQFAFTLCQRKLCGGEWLPRFLCNFYRYTGCKYYLGCHGLSIYAIFQKPEKKDA